MGNETITDLLGIERMEALQGSISPDTHKKRSILIGNLTHIYSYGVNKEFLTTEEAIGDFICNGIKNEYQIEVIYYIILFDATIKNESLIHLIEFFLRNNKQIDNFFYKEFSIKIIAQITRRFHSSQERLTFFPLVEKIRVSLQEKDISHSILSYSKVYLSLALYYVECEGKEYTEYAKICFLHYKNLNIPLVGIDKNMRNAQDEKDFYTTL